MLDHILFRAQNQSTRLSSLRNSTASFPRAHEKFMTAKQLLRKKCVEDLQVVKVAPPSVLCRRLWEKTNHREMEDIRAFALAAFGTTNAKHVEAVQKWFAHRRLQNFPKAKEHLKWRFGMVTPGVKGEVERLLWQASGSLGMNGQCTVAGLKRLLTYLDLSCSGPKAELMQRVYDHADSLRSYVGLPANTTFVPEESMAEENEDEDEDIVCFTASMVIHLMGPIFSFVRVHILPRLVGTNCA